jgi:hypothetical protein
MFDESTNSETWLNWQLCQPVVRITYHNKHKSWSVISPSIEGNLLYHIHLRSFRPAVSILFVPILIISQGHCKNILAQYQSWCVKYLNLLYHIHLRSFRGHPVLYNGWVKLSKVLDGMFCCFVAFPFFECAQFWKNLQNYFPTSHTIWGFIVPGQMPLV